MAKERYETVIIGNPGVGKTTFIRQYDKNEFIKTYSTTSTADYIDTECTVNSRKIQLRIWDVPGKERYSNEGGVRPYFRNADCCVLMFDVTDHRSFEAIKFWRAEFLKEKKPGKYNDFPFIVLGTKVDKTGRQVVKSEAMEWCRHNGNMLYFDIKLNEHHLVAQTFQVIGSCATMNDLDLNAPDTEEDSASLQPNPIDRSKNQSTCLDSAHPSSVRRQSTRPSDNKSGEGCNLF